MKFSSFKLFIVFYATFQLFINFSSFAQNGNFIVPIGHTSTIKQVKLDNQGKYIYSLETLKIIMWDANTSEQLYTFLLNADEVDGFTLSNDGTKLAVVANSSIICFSTVTGKELFRTKGHYFSSATFSSDDLKIYSVYDGVMEIDANNGDYKSLIKMQLSFYNAKIEVLANNRILIHNNFGWQIWDVNLKKLESKVELPKQVFSHTYLAAYGYMGVHYNDSELTILKVIDGSVVKKFKIGGNDFALIPSIDSKELILGTNDYEEEFAMLYNSELMPIKVIKAAKRISTGIFYGTKSMLIATSYNDMVMTNTKTDKIVHKFKRQVADLGRDVFSSLEYNYVSGILNIMTDDSVYKSINLVKLMPFRHQKITNSGRIAFSKAGDTIANFQPSKGYVKNLKTGKILWSAFKKNDDFNDSFAIPYFFSKDGNYVYNSTFSIPKQLNTVNKLNLKTGVNEKVFSYSSLSNLYLHPDKELCSAIEWLSSKESIKVWNVTTGKIVFNKLLAKDEKYQYTAISGDQKKLMAISSNIIHTYDMLTGKHLDSVKARLDGTKGTYATTNDFSMVFLADDQVLKAVNAKGELLYKVKAHGAEVRRILLSPDSKILYTAGTDQTIKVWEAKTGFLLGTLYLFNDGNDFVFLDAYGRFDGTDGGIKKMYYYSNRIKIKLDVVYEVYYTPNLYQRLVNGERFEPINITINPMPLVKIEYEQKLRNLTVEDDKPSFINTSGIAELTIKASATNDLVDEIRIFHNGKAVNLATRGLFVTNDETGLFSKKYTINLLPGINTFRAIVLNKQRTESLPDEITVNYQAANNVVNKPTNLPSNKVATVEKSATLHLVVVGINTYQNDKLSLNYAIADATAFKNEIEKKSISVITNVKTYFITNLDANKTNITAAFNEVQKNAKPADVFVFYYAGHGVIADKSGEFYLVPTDVKDLKNIDDELQQKGIPAKAIQEYAVNIQAQKQLFILDACQSAGAFQQLLAAEANQQKSISMVARSTGTHWMAASGAQQFANEFSQLGHGAFTYILLQALKGEAANDKMVTVNGLKQFLQIKVPELMKKYNGTAQYPASYGNGFDFPVSVIK